MKIRQLDLRWCIGYPLRLLYVMRLLNWNVRLPFGDPKPYLQGSSASRVRHECRLQRISPAVCSSQHPRSVNVTPRGGSKTKNLHVIFFRKKKKVIIELNCGEKKSWPVQASRRYHLRPAYNYQHPKRSVVMERLGSWPRPLQLLYWCHFFLQMTTRALIGSSAEYANNLCGVLWQFLKK